MIGFQFSILNSQLSSRICCAFVVVLGCFFTGCGEGESEKARELTVGVAASLGPLFDDVATLYMESHPDVKIVSSSAGSNLLLRQTKAGAPFDLVALASSDLMEDLVSTGFVDPDQTTTLASNRLILIVPRDAERPITLGNLLFDQYQRIGIASPGVPAGDYAREALGNLGLEEMLKEKMIGAGNVRAVLAWVERGEVDCGFVYLSDTLGAERVDLAFQIDSTLHTPITYPVGVATSTTNRVDAEKFLQFLSSDGVRRLVVEHRFRLP